MSLTINDSRPLIIVTAAGKGQRMQRMLIGSNIPKPLIRINGRCLIEWSLKPLFPLITSGKITFSDVYVVISKEAPCPEYMAALSAISPKISIVQLKDPTDSPVTTALLGVESICDQVGPEIMNRPVLFSDADHFYIVPRLTRLVEGLISSRVSLLTAELPQSQDYLWSHLRLNDGKVVKILEKEPLSASSKYGDA